MTSAARANRNADIVDRLEAENERLRLLFEDACKVFDHYDLPEHALHYRRVALGMTTRAALSPKEGAGIVESQSDVPLTRKGGSK